MSDILFHHDNYIVSYRVSGILVCDDKVLLQAPKNTGEYAFIGGHVALGETNAETLIREWREEVGADIEVGELKWVELFVDEQHRRKGIASRLMEYAESYYSDKNIGGFQLFTGGVNISAQRFYEHIGYSKTDEIMYRKRK